LQLLACCYNGDAVSLRDRAILLLLLDTGIRVGELVFPSQFITRLSPPKVYRRSTEILNLAPDQLLHR